MLVLGVTLMIAGLALVVAEAHAGTGGFLAAGGVVAAVAGLAVLLSGAGLGTVWSVILAIAIGLVLLAAIALVARSVGRSLRVEPRTGPDRLVGAAATVSTWSGTHGQVMVDGAIWAADLDLGWEPAAIPQRGEVVVVEGRRGLTLIVRPRQTWELHTP
jgi:membrane-bound serine protease (ClpP class)